MKKIKGRSFFSGLIITSVICSSFSFPVFAEQYTDSEGDSLVESDFSDAALSEDDDADSTIESTDDSVSAPADKETSASEDFDTPTESSDSILESNEESEEFGNTVIDLNSDGKTDDSDITAFRELVKNYNADDHSRQEIPGELTKILYGRTDTSNTEAVPNYTRYFLNNTGQATSVKDQMSFGNCWSFAAISALESSILKQRQTLSGENITRTGNGEPVLSGISDTVDLSEKYLSWAVFDTDLREPGQDEGLISLKKEQDILNTGGWTGAAEKLWTSWRGIVREEEEPYRSDTSSYKYFEQPDDENWSLSGKIYKTGDETAVARVKNSYLLPSPAVIEFKEGKNTWTDYDSSATDAIKQALAETGAVAITFGVDQSSVGESGNRSYFNNTTWSQYYDSETVTENHAVTIVGWDDSYPAKNFLADKNSLPPGDGAWLVKNSWGSYDYYEKLYGNSFTDLDDEFKADATWGIRDENGMGTGYFWLSYYDKTIASAMAFDVDIPEDGWDYDRIYQYDLYNDAANNTLILRMYDTDTSVSNVFTSDRNERLEAVSVRITEPGSRVNVKVYLLDNNTELSEPTNGKLVSELDTSLESAGFKTLKLKTPVELKPGQSFAVVENIIAESGYEGSAVSFLNVETIIDESLQNNKNMVSARSNVYAGVGETFIKILKDGAYVWLTPGTLTTDIGGGIFTFGNALIKAFTNIIEQEQEPDKTPDISQNSGNTSKNSKNSRGIKKRAAAHDTISGTATFADESRAVQKSAGKDYSSQTKVVAAQTGDKLNTALWIVPVGAFAAIISAFIFSEKKSRQEQ